MPHAGLLKSHTVTRVNKGVKSLNAVLDVLAGASLAAHLSVASMITPPVTMTMPVAVTEVRQGMYKEYTIEKTDNAVVDNAKSGFKKVEETEENKNKYWTILAVLIAGSFIIPMVQYFWYIAEED
eukprot:gene6559-7237_t